MFKSGAPESGIRKARKSAGLTSAQLGHALGWSAETLGRIEIGKVPLAPGQEQQILTAIARLARFQVAVDQAKAKLLADLKLNPSRVTISTP